MSVGLHRPLEGGDVKTTGWQRDTSLQDGAIRDGADCGPRLVAVKTEGLQQKAVVAPLTPSPAAPTDVTPCRQAGRVPASRGFLQAQ